MPPTARQLELWYDWGCTIQGARRAADLTQAALAAELGLSRRTVENWECGRRAPSLAMRRRLCKRFGLPQSQLGALADYCGCCGAPL